MKTRFAFVNGIWQLCMVVAAFTQEQQNNPHLYYRDYLILYTRKTSNQKLVDFVETISEKFWNWQGVIRVDWTTSEWNQKLNKDKYSSVQQILDKFKIASPSLVDEICLCKIQFLDERLCADIFDKAKILLYEDGLHTYAQTQYLIELPSVDLTHPKTTVAKYKNLVKGLIVNQFDWQHQGVKRNHVKRIKKFYSVLGGEISVSSVLSKIPVESIEPSLLKNLFLELNHRLQCQFYPEISKHNSKTALLLGSNLSHIHYFPRQAEVSAFAHIIQQLTEKGYKIFWKEHPRNQKPLFEDIKQLIPSENIVYIEGEQKIPIEILISENKIDICCSTLSSSLFYLRYIYGIKTITCVRPLLQFLTGDFRKLAELTLTHIEETL